MGNLRSAIDDLGSEQLWKLSNEELAAELEDLHRDATALEAQRLRRLAEFDRRRAYADDGYVSATAWVTHRCRVDGSTAQT
jgi:alpha-D-ribose 1-methylphosphonate 5-triphosphate synthase subunit PhnI